jgi:acyl-CoA dehydrogenase
MPIVFDDTQEMLRDSAAFLKDNAPISALRTLRDHA